MLNKRIISIVLALVAAFSVLLMGGCQKMSYGTVLESREKLLLTMKEKNLDFKYPLYLGEKNDDTESQYVAVKSADDEDYTGYKIYQFGSPFYTSVTAYNEESDNLMSDETSRTDFLKKLSSSKGEISVYSGKGHKDALYLIGIINIDGKHYEVRVTSDEEMEDNNYIHAIYEDNKYYTQSLELIVKVIESIA